MHKALRFANAETDGDTIFAAATARAETRPELNDLVAIGARAADCLARAIARAVYEAAALPCCPQAPAWRDRFGGDARP
jgi:D-aminopeptidase